MLIRNTCIETEYFAHKPDLDAIIVSVIQRIGPSFSDAFGSHNCFIASVTHSILIEETINCFKEELLENIKRSNNRI